MNSDIISLQETSADNWQAKYRGNYGTYTIKIKIDEKKMISFSCSCPSDYSPCKHINMVKEAIDIRIAESKKSSKENTITVKELLMQVTHQELSDFIVRHAKYNPDLTNKILLEFVHKTKTIDENNYSLILRKALKKYHFDYDDLYEYHEDTIEIDILDEWLTKAQEYISQKRFDETIAICKACIEEYAEWMEEFENDVIEYIDPVYQEKPFELLKEIVSNPVINSDELFQYCIAEMSKTKYAETDMYDGFNNLLLEFSHTKNNAAEFIALQDKLLKNITDKSSYEAQKIIERKIALYKKNNQSEIAQQLIEDNIQIESFRKQVVEQKISDKKFSEAKKLISDFLSTYQNNNFHYHSEWNELILNIAQKEADIPVIRKESFAFIGNYFQTKYYRIYKSTFNPDDWKNELENIIEHYEKKGKYFSDSMADVLAEEKDATRLMKYIEKYLSLGRMEKYHSYFALAYPAETLDLFGKAMNQYAEINTGRNHYEYMVTLFKKIAHIKGGNEMITTMIYEYKNKYKNRRAMIEILNKIKL